VLKLGRRGAWGSYLSVNGLVAIAGPNGIVVSAQINPMLYTSAQERSLTAIFDNAAPAVKRTGAWQSNYTGAGISVALIDSGSQHAS